MTPLTSALRNQLERVVIQARDAAEAAARSSLQRRAVDAAEPFEHFDAKQKALRNRLRARGRQVGDTVKADKTQTIDHLTQELAYDYWHRMLFARFLAENHLLMHPDGVPVSLEECDELAKDAVPPARNGFALAARYASTMLPQVFRVDDVLMEVDFDPGQRLALEKLLASLPKETFVADDSLGWVYQFWQSKRKGEVNASGNKIGAEELPSVTQLFTENYMVDFLLDNTLGAWHAGKVLAAHPKLAEVAKSEEELRKAVALPGCPWAYLRFIKAKSGTWTPAAGTFDGWPKAAKDLKCLDPCMGSGHFVVAMFERLVALRLAEEKLDEAAAVAAVIRDNLFGLEIDPRCTQIGAFNLALAAWRRVGHCKLPAMNLACSGLAPNTREADWLAIAGDNSKLQNGMERLYRLFKDAPVLGSLINPRTGENGLLLAAFHDLQPLLEKALARESKDETAHEMAVTARGLAKAAEILAGQFALVATNVPYLGRNKHDDVLKDYCERVHPDAKADLATCFLERCLNFCGSGGSTGLVTPQNWLFLSRYERLRRRLLSDFRWNFAGRLGEHAFGSSQAAGAFVALFAFTAAHPAKNHHFFGVEVSDPLTPSEKAEVLLSGASVTVDQASQLLNPEHAVGFASASERTLLSNFASSIQGFGTSDNAPFIRTYWELPRVEDGWVFSQSACEHTVQFGGRHNILLWEDGKGQYFRHAMRLKKEGRMGGWRSGGDAWGKTGISISEMREMHCTIFTGEMFDNTAHAIVPNRASDTLPIWEFLSSGELVAALRETHKGLKVSNHAVLNVSFDLAHWQKVAAEKYPHGLPKPFSSDPTQWLFNGHPAGSDQPLHVAVARLLGYQWPRQTGSSFPDCPALGPDGLEKLGDEDGIVCIPGVRTEAPAADRLLDMLRKAHGKAWSESLLHKLLTDAGCDAGATLDDWLRNQFFEQHYKLFHHRPFIWHLWDGRRDGFSALVNYHKLDHKGLENLTYAYLGDWIAAQSKSNKVGADLRLAAAQELQEKLKLILAGAPPYDIFVRWKPLHEQAIGWHPDLNDGVRVNIRPFVEAGILRKTPNIKWTKDRGKEPMREKKDYPWFWKGDSFIGDRVNDVHLTFDEKGGK